MPIAMRPSRTIRCGSQTRAPRICRPLLWIEPMLCRACQPTARLLRSASATPQLKKYENSRADIDYDTHSWTDPVRIRRGTRCDICRQIAPRRRLQVQAKRDQRADQTGRKRLPRFEKED